MADVFIHVWPEFSQQMGLLPTVLPGSCWAVQLAACRFLDEVVALQIFSVARVALA